MEIELLGQLGQYGLLGVILALVGWIAMQLWKDLKSSWEIRITDNKQLVQVMEASNSTYSSLAAATESRAKATEAVSEAQLATARVLQSQVEVLKKVEENQREIIRCLDNLTSTIKHVEQEVKRK